MRVEWIKLRWTLCDFDLVFGQAASNWRICLSGCIMYMCVCISVLYAALGMCVWVIDICNTCMCSCALVSCVMLLYVSVVVTLVCGCISVLCTDIRVCAWVVSLLCVRISVLCAAILSGCVVHEWLYLLFVCALVSCVLISGCMCEWLYHFYVCALVSALLSVCMCGWCITCVCVH